MANLSDFSNITVGEGVANEGSPFTLGGMALLYNNSYYEVSKAVGLKYVGAGVCVSGGFYKKSADGSGVEPATSAEEAEYFAFCAPQNIFKKKLVNYNALASCAATGNTMQFINLGVSGIQFCPFVLTKEAVNVGDFVTFNDEYSVKKAGASDKKLAVVVKGGCAGDVIVVDFNVK